MANHCFGCGPDNPFGLHLHFHPEGDGVAATFVCEERHVGWPGIQHGGITGSLLDEASGYVPYALGLFAVTAELNVSFVEAVYEGEVLQLTAKPVKKSRRIIEVEAELKTEDGRLKARSWAKMVVLSKEQQEARGFTVPEDDLPWRLEV